MNIAKLRLAAALLCAAGVIATVRSATAANSCIPAAIGVPTKEGPPKWTDHLNHDTPGKPSYVELDDPRWLGASSETFAMGSARAPLQTRAVWNHEGANDYLYLSFTTNINPNTTTARDLGALMASIERGTAASPRSTQLMKEVLLRQEFNSEIPAGLPAGTPVAHKTGSITATLHDAAIVYPKSHPPYVLVILTRNIAREQVAQLLMADLSRMVYTFAVRDSRSAAKASP